MKTAEEWIPATYDVALTHGEWKRWIQAIQSDARYAALTEAAEVARKWPKKSGTYWTKGQAKYDDIAKDILSLRDNQKG